MEKKMEMMKEKGKTMWLEGKDMEGRRGKEERK
jgi:hypothetical protein